MPLSREAILKADDIATEEVQVPEWGGSVLVRGMTGRQRDAFETSMVVRNMTGRPGNERLASDTDSRDMRAKLVARCVVDETGDLLFTDGDIEALTAKSGAALDRVFEAASRLSGLGPRDMEEMSANFGGTPSGGSSSASPNGSAARPKNSSAKSAAAN